MSSDSWERLEYNVEKIISYSYFTCRKNFYQIKVKTGFDAKMLNSTPHLVAQISLHFKDTTAM